MATQQESQQKSPQTLEEWLKESPEERAVRHACIQEGIADAVYDNEPYYKNKEDGVKEMMRKYPIWKFYRYSPKRNSVSATCRDASASQAYKKEEGNRMPVRVYGVCEYDNGKYGLHAVSCHIGFSNDVVGGIHDPDDCLEEVKSEDLGEKNYMMWVKTNNCDPLVWLEPMGVSAFLPNE